jgi:predicted RecB family nuclease
MKDNISKPIFLNSLVCPSYGWLQKHDETDNQTAAETRSLAAQLRIEQGIEIGRRARELYTNGVIVDAKNLEEAAKKTSKLLADKNQDTIFEPTFLIDGYVTKADILRRTKTGWHLVEVKSSANDKPELVDELAYTQMVMMRSGMTIDSASLMLVSKDYRLGMPDKALFNEIDHTADSLIRALEFEKYWDIVKRQLEIETKPVPELRFACRDCDLFSECVGKDIGNHIFEIPRISQKKFDLLVAKGIFTIEDIPDTFELTENQSMIRTCVISKQPWVSPQLQHTLNAIIWPAYYLDFETTMTAIPLYPDMAPYTQIPTQYSIHKCSNIGQVIDHREYLCDPRKDDRRSLAEHLIKDLENKGSILSYSSFEKTTINNLARLYPDIADKLERLTVRLVDLNAIIRQHFYHPDFHGSLSIKTTLPVLVPDMSYSNLEIGDGDSASAAFAYLAMGRYSQKEAETLRQNLLIYCAQDTMAMVKLHDRLHSWER